MKTLNSIISILHGTTQQFVAMTTPLADGELAYDTTANKFKVGDGITLWQSLPYVDAQTIGVIDSLSSLSSTDALSAKQGYVLSQTKMDNSQPFKTINGQSIKGTGDITIGGGGSTVVIDTLTSTSTTAALSANQGRVLKQLVDTKADATDIPTVGNGTITITQGGETKGTFTTNQTGNTTIDLAGGGGSSVTIDTTWSSPSNSKVPSSLLVKNSLDAKADSSALSNYETSAHASTTYATKLELQAKADASTLSNYETTTHASTTYATKTELTNGLAAKANTSDIPIVGNGTITITQGGETKGTFTTNQSGDTTIALAGGGQSVTIDTDWTNPTNTSVPSSLLTKTALDAKANMAQLTNYETTTHATTTYATKSEVTTGLAAKADTTALSAYETTTHAAATYATKTELEEGLDEKLDSDDLHDTTITLTQGGVTKGSFTLNQATAATIDLDAGGGSSIAIDTEFPVTPLNTNVPSTKLVSDTLATKMNSNQSFKTINGLSLIGAGNIELEGGSSAESTLNYLIHKFKCYQPTSSPQIAFRGTWKNLNFVSGKTYHIKFIFGSGSPYTGLSVKLQHSDTTVTGDQQIGPNFGQSLDTDFTPNDNYDQLFIYYGGACDSYVEIGVVDNVLGIMSNYVGPDAITNADARNDILNLENQTRKFKTAYKFACMGDSITSSQVSNIGTMVNTYLGTTLVGNFAVGSAHLTNPEDFVRSVVVPNNVYTNYNTLENQVIRLLQWTTASGAQIKWTYTGTSDEYSVDTAVATGLGHTTDIPDIVYIAIGINDAIESIGDDKDTVLTQAYSALTRRTFASALRWAIETLRCAYPNVQIFVATPLYTGVNSDPYRQPTVLAKRNLLYELCVHNGVHCIDSTQRAGYTTQISQTIIGTGHEGIHPRSRHKCQIAKFIAKEIYNNYTSQIPDDEIIY